MKKLILILTTFLITTNLVAQTYSSINRVTHTNTFSIGPDNDFTKFIFSEKEVTIVNSDGSDSSTYEILYENPNTGYTLVRLKGTMINYELTITKDYDSNLQTIRYCTSPRSKSTFISFYTTVIESSN